MSLDLLGDGFDIHGGGLDLAFPHHENERAQAVAAGRTFARHWVHNGFVEVGGEKMSKSLGNFTNLLDLIESHRPPAPTGCSCCGPTTARRSRSRRPPPTTPRPRSKKFDSLARCASPTPTCPSVAARRRRRWRRFRAAMDDDLDTPRVMALLSEIRRRANTALDMRGPGRSGVARRGVPRDLRRPRAWCSTPAATRCRPRSWPWPVSATRPAPPRTGPQADALRDQLVADGWVVEDTPSGTQVRPA